MQALALAFGLALSPAPSPGGTAPDEAAPAKEARAHGPEAPTPQFPSHTFRARAHAPKRVQLGFHYGLSQPIFLQGFNAAVDVRYRRFVASYSHGQGLRYSNIPGLLSDAEQAANLQIVAPYSTGLGVGAVLVDELFVLADVKLHHFELRAGSSLETYSTLTLGLELGWRFFVWKGLYVAPVLRYWPNVWTSAPDEGVRVATSEGELLHEPIKQGAQGFFGNLLIGWAFGL